MMKGYGIMTRIMPARIGMVMAAVCMLAGAATAWAQSAQLYVSSASGNKVLRYDGVSGNFIDVIVPALTPGLAIPSGLVLSADGNLCVGSSGLHRILRFNVSTGAFRPGPLGDPDTAEFVPEGSGGLNTPFGMTLRGGRLYVTSRGSDEVLRYDGASGAFIDAFVGAASGGLNGPDDLTFGPDGNLYVTSLNTNSVLRYNRTTGLLIGVFVLPESGGLRLPRGLIFGPDGNLYVSSVGTNSILRYNGTTGDFIDTFVPSQSGGLSFPRDLLFGSDGNLYVCSQLSNSILRYDGRTGGFMGAFVPPGSGGLVAPGFMVFSDGGSGSNNPPPSGDTPPDSGTGMGGGGTGGGPPPLIIGFLTGANNGCGSGLCGIGTAMTSPMMLLGLCWMRRRRPRARW